MWDEFKRFAIKGNIFDLAVGVLVGNAFSKIVNSLVFDIIMPVFGIPLGKINFANLFIQIGGEVHYQTIEEAQAAGVATINYGLFINNIINFLIIALSIFFVLKQLTKVRRHFN